MGDLLLSSSTPKTVISTGAAHASVSSGAEKFASLRPSATHPKNKVEKSGKFSAPV
jgi:hypothetical protein